MNDTIIVYTDGATSNNQTKESRIAASGFVVVNDIVKGYYLGNQTNNVAELVAIDEALHYVLGKYKHVKKIDLFTDSKYCFDIFTGKTKNIKVNNDIIERINRKIYVIGTKNKQTLKFHKVKGHSSDKNNKYADKIAVMSRESKKNLQFSYKEFETAH